jgi:hypothetical protein
MVGEDIVYASGRPNWLRIQRVWLAIDSGCKSINEIERLWFRTNGYNFAYRGSYPASRRAGLDGMPEKL